MQVQCDIYSVKLSGFVLLSSSRLDLLFLPSVILVFTSMGDGRDIHIVAYHMSIRRPVMPVDDSLQLLLCFRTCN